MLQQQMQAGMIDGSAQGLLDFKTCWLKRLRMVVPTMV